MKQRATFLSFIQPTALFGRADRSVTALLKDQRGAGAIEFAILLPILIVLYAGAVEFNDAFTAKRKVTSAASGIGDVVTRTKELSSATLKDVLDWAPVTILKPYPVAGANTDIKVTCVAIDKDKIATVKWSETRDSQKDQVGAKISLPAGVVLASSKLVAVEMTYKYKPTLGAYLGDEILFTSKFYFKPRVQGTVCYNDVCC